MEEFDLEKELKENGILDYTFDRGNDTSWVNFNIGAIKLSIPVNEQTTSIDFTNSVNNHYLHELKQIEKYHTNALKSIRNKIENYTEVWNKR